MEKVLLLNADHRPLKTISWQRAVVLLLEDKVQVVKTYADRLIRSASGLALPWPAVVALKAFAKMSKHLRARVRFQRSNVLARDSWTCAYCGAQPKTIDGRPDISTLSVDHVIPRAHARDGKVTLPWSGEVVPVTCWAQVVTACERCNGLKADRTPAQAGMKLRYLPRVPTGRDIVRILLSKTGVPEEWRDHLSV